MSVILPKEVIRLLKSKDTKKVLATVDKNGIPNVAFKDSVDVNEDGNIEVTEFLETSRTNKNLTYSLWFDKTVAVSVWDETGAAYELKGIPVKVHISGPLFEQKYKEDLAIDPINDISGVWVIKPTEVRNQTYAERKKEQDEKYPIIGHLDKDRRTDDKIS